MTKQNTKDKETKSPSRNYSSKTIKILFATCMNECAHPDCTTPIIQPKTELSDAAVIGHIAHIFAASNDGPRGKASLSEADRNLPDNLLLLCPTHHSVVDKQHETYPAAMLLGWKSSHERKFQDSLGAKIGDIGFDELELTANSLLSKEPVGSEGGLTIIRTPDKIAKNRLNNRSQTLLQMGTANSAEVEDLIAKTAQLNPEFPDRLREGFVARYNAFVAEGFEGDDLFIAMYEWAAGSRTDIIRKTAGLCVLAHLFIICDVFEK